MKRLVYLIVSENFLAKIGRVVDGCCFREIIIGERLLQLNL